MSQPTSAELISQIEPRNPGSDFFGFRGLVLPLRRLRNPGTRRILYATTCIAILENHGWKFHTVDKRRYYFTNRKGSPQDFSLEELRRWAASTVLAYQYLVRRQAELHGRDLEAEFDNL